MSRNLSGWGEQEKLEERRQKLIDVGLLILRIGIGALMLFAHGSSKLVAFGELSAVFPDPLGVGSVTSLSLAIFAEFFCALAIAFGLFTRWATAPLIILLLVAAFGVHGSDPWPKQEMAVVYLIPFIAIAFTGPGRYSLDRLIFSKRMF